ncbi:MAG: hypothetical protein JO080_16305 [Mucilaginibacter sp.]|nr:hypothetical protein [Mucilaginibacter sp.]
MKSKYYLMLSLKYHGGYKCFGEYYLGSDSKRANEIFAGLKGKSLAYEDRPLNIDMIIITNDVPETAKTVACNLDEFASNCKYIAKEIFRMNNLELS